MDSMGKGWKVVLGKREVRREEIRWVWARARADWRVEIVKVCLESCFCFWAVVVDRIVAMFGCGDVDWDRERVLRRVNGLWLLVRKIEVLGEAI